MKILSAEQTRQADAYTIANEPIASIDLMERASLQCFNWLRGKFNQDQAFTIFCGVGNNGGDGLAVARMLHEAGYNVEVHLVEISENYSSDCRVNLNRLIDLGVKVDIISNGDITIDREQLVIDAIFGSGLTRPIEGFAKDIVKAINAASNKVVAIDLPSGLFCEDNSSNDQEAIIQANYTLTFQQPKLAMMFPQNFDYVGEFVVLPIGLHQGFIDQLDTTHFYTVEQDIRPVLQERLKFSHKGTYGHALLVAGSKGKIGAAVLAGQACLRTGVGLLTIQTPKIGCDIIQTAVPEAMCLIDDNESVLSSVPNLDGFSAIGVGPGIGTSIETQQVLKLVIQNTNSPMVLDADALNILSENKTWLDFIPEQTILTPHPKEFERLVGSWKNDEERLHKQLELSKKYRVILVLKGANTAVSFPNGDVCFNSTGNPGMATGGSGDVLTGVLASLLAQGYSPVESTIIGVYLHGYAGDLACTEIGEQAMVASDIINHIPGFFKAIKNT